MPPRCTASSLKRDSGHRQSPRWEIATIHFTARGHLHIYFFWCSGTGLSLLPQRRGESHTEHTAHTSCICSQKHSGRKFQKPLHYPPRALSGASTDRTRVLTSFLTDSAIHKEAEGWSTHTSAGHSLSLYLRYTNKALGFPSGRTKRHLFLLAEAA